MILTLTGDSSTPASYREEYDMTDIQSVVQNAYAQLFASSSGYNLRQLSGLDLSESQRTQVRSILHNAKSEALTQDQIQQQIASVLTPQQLTTLQGDQSQSGSSTSSNTSTASASAASGSNNPFGNLSLTSSQDSEIDQLLQSAQSGSLSFDQFTSQLSSILTPDQQSTLTTDIQGVLQQINAAADSQASQNGPSTPFNEPNGPFANLNLSAAQQTQIQTILLGSNGFSFDQINSQINAVLTSAQQTTFASDLQILQGTGASSAPSSPSPSSASSSSSTSLAAQNVFDNLNLTSSQHSQIASILQNAQSHGLSPSDVLTQIESVLSSSQQTTLGQNIQSLQPGSAEAQYRGGVSATDAQNQVSAANSAVAQYLQYELNVAGSATSGSTT